MDRPAGFLVFARYSFFDFYCTGVGKSRTYKELFLRIALVASDCSHYLRFYQNWIMDQGRQDVNWRVLQQA